MPFTTYPTTRFMTEETFDRRLDQLIRQVMQHPHKDEVLQLAQDQLMDDTFVLVSSE